MSAPESLVDESWHCVESDGMPEVGETVLGGHWYTDPYLIPEKATQFLFGPCRVFRTEDLRSFPHGKQWHTFGPSHNQITHWRRINPPSKS